MNRSGFYKKNLSGDLAYQSFVPASLPPKPSIEFDDETVKLLVKANKDLAVLDGISARIPNVSLFISMYIRKEALMSSQIEGTQATLEDILDPAVENNANCNVSEVINYIRATEFAIKRLQELPLCNRLIRETHAVLMQGVRGCEKEPGEFRHTQNWIGGVGSTLKNARFIPPEPADMQEAISELEKYMNIDDGVDPLIRVALIHYQFETIHPFLDGNGRVGRLLITLFLIQNRILTSPALYISYFLKKNRIEYYDRLGEVRQKGNYEQWVKFFLQAVHESAEDAISAIDKLSALHNNSIELISKIKRNATLISLLEYLETNPIVEVGKTAKALSISYNAANNAVLKLSELNILIQTAGNRRNRTYSYSKYLDILRDGT